MRASLPVLALFAAALPSAARADFVTDWIVFAHQMEAKLPPARGVPPTAGEHAYDVSQVALAMFEALNAIDPAYQSVVGLPPAEPGASPEAAAATAAHQVLKACLPAQAKELDDSYAIAMAGVLDTAAREKGQRAGEAAAAAALKRGGVDPGLKQSPYRPLMAPGTWSATDLPVFEPFVLAFRPWAMPSAAALRPPPPPKLSSERWAKDYEEVKRFGGKTASSRTPAQTIVARYRVAPDIMPTAAWIADQPGRRPVQNARMHARLAMAANDITIAIADAKLHYNFWRPISAIRNADKDGNAKTELDPGWAPLLATPNHPEYPCGHCIFAAGEATVLADEGILPPDGVRFRTQAATAILERVPTLDAYVQTVSDSRIYAGVHYRFSNEAAEDMGRKAARLVLDKLMQPLGSLKAAALGPCFHPQSALPSVRWSRCRQSGARRDRSPAPPRGRVAVWPR